MGFYWILGDILPEFAETFAVHHLNFREAPLPNFAQIARFQLESAREPSFDELHCFFDRHGIMHSNKRVEVIGHDYEIQEFELQLSNQGA